MVDGSIIDAVGHCPKGTFTGSSGCGLELSNSGFFVVFTIFSKGPPLPPLSFLCFR